MRFAGVASRNVSFPSSLFRTALVYGDFSTLGDPDIAQTSMLGKKMFRGIRQLKKKKKKEAKPKYITLQGHPQEAYELFWASFEYLPYFSNLPNHGGSLRQLPASESPPISPGLAQMLPSPCLSIATTSLSLQKEK